MSLTFYYAPMSTAIATVAVLAELGTKHDAIKMSFQDGDTRKPEFLKINPNGKVPTIVHDGVAIWESAAITMYLGEVFGVDAKLYPAPGLRRGEAMKWITWANVSLAEAAMRLAYASAPGNEAVAAKASTDLDGLLKILDEALTKQPFLLKDYTLADTHLSAFVGWISMMKPNVKDLVHVSSWLQKCGDRPALKNLGQ